MPTELRLGQSGDAFHKSRNRDHALQSQQNKAVKSLIQSTHRVRAESQFTVTDVNVCMINTSVYCINNT